MRQGEFAVIFKPRGDAVYTWAAGNGWYFNCSPTTRRKSLPEALEEKRHCEGITDWPRIEIVRAG